MFGTVARLQLKPGASLDEFNAINDQERGIPGMVGSYVYKMDNEPNTLYLAVIFESRESYVANAQSPEQNERFMHMMEFLAAEPEWHDGDIVWAFPAA